MTAEGAFVKSDLCRGCDNDFYNGNNPLGVKQCWSFKGAKIVTRWKLGWWTFPNTPGAFTEVKTLNCHTESGHYDFQSVLPSSAIKPHRLPKKPKRRKKS